MNDARATLVRCGMLKKHEPSWFISPEDEGEEDIEDANKRQPGEPLWGVHCDGQGWYYTAILDPAEAVEAARLYFKVSKKCEATVRRTFPRADTYNEILGALWKLRMRLRRHYEDNDAGKPLIEEVTVAMEAMEEAKQAQAPPPGFLFRYPSAVNTERSRSRSRMKNEEASWAFGAGWKEWQVGTE